MKQAYGRRWIVLSLLALALLLPGWAAAQPTFSRVVVFGDSLSDPGNAFALTGFESTPPYDTLSLLLIPGAPYAKGGHHFSNGATWVEQLARPLGLAGSVRPALQGSNDGASNYAVGGARAHEDGSRINLSAQVDAFLRDVNYAAPPDALYVIEIGGNDIRDVLEHPEQAEAIVAGALGAIGSNIFDLYAKGARKFLVWNAPDLGLTPAIRSLGSDVAQAVEGFTRDVFNANLDGALGLLAGLPGIEIKRFDVFTKLKEIVKDPAAFGLSVANAACVTPNVPPFECQKPDEYLFWDGIHPTKAGHDIIAQEAAFALKNAPLIMEELYTAPLFGTFTLSREGVDPATISIRVLSDANALIDLVRNTHYIVEPSGNTMLITIVSLPAAVTAGRLAGYVYTFQVTYALTSGAVELETTTVGVR